MIEKKLVNMPVVPPLRPLPRTNFQKAPSDSPKIAAIAISLLGLIGAASAYLALRTSSLEPPNQKPIIFHVPKEPSSALWSVASYCSVFCLGMIFCCFDRKHSSHNRPDLNLIRSPSQGGPYPPGSSPDPKNPTEATFTKEPSTAPEPSPGYEFRAAMKLEGKFEKLRRSVSQRMTETVESSHTATWLRDAIPMRFNKMVSFFPHYYSPSRPPETQSSSS